MLNDQRSSPVDQNGSPLVQPGSSFEHHGIVLLRGGGDLASGVALRLHHAGIQVVISELEHPLAVRRTVSFAEAVYEKQHKVEGVGARLVKPEEIPAALAADEIPVLIDPDATILTSQQFTSHQYSDHPLPSYQFVVVVDARLLKVPPVPLPVSVPLHVGLGPGFNAGINCHAVIETRRSHTLGRVYWNGTTQPDSGMPEGDPRRVLRAAFDGVLLAKAKIGEHVEEGQVIATIREQHRPGSVAMYPVVSPIKGVLRGLIRDGSKVTKRLKIGDVDPRDQPSACFLVSDKALAIGGAVLEAVLTRGEIRERLFTARDAKEREDF